MANKEMHLSFVGVAMCIVYDQAQRVRAIAQTVGVPFAEFAVEHRCIIARKRRTERAWVVADAVLQFIAGKGRCIGDAKHGDDAAHHFPRNWLADRDFRFERINVTGVGGWLGNPMCFSPLPILRRVDLEDFFVNRVLRCKFVG